MDFQERPVYFLVAMKFRKDRQTNEDPKTIYPNREFAIDLVVMANASGGEIRVMGLRRRYQKQLARDAVKR